MMVGLFKGPQVLREYQTRAISLVFDWIRANTGNPCVVMPTGSGKSHVIAHMCKTIIQKRPELRILMLTHVKELLEQNAQKMREHWPGAPMGIYSASLGRKDLGEPITFAGIQSIRKKHKMVGHIDVVVIDECHTVGHKDEGGYREFIRGLKEINPRLRVIGFSATPYRLGHGMITDKPAIFDGIVEPILIEELLAKGYLSKLRSKATEMKLDVSGVHKRGGEFIESELQAAVDTDDNNNRVAKEIILFSGSRKSWLIFCAGVDHANHMADVLNQNGISARCILGETPKKEREKILDEFRDGQITALTNANVLTTGFDSPRIDLIAMLRPTMSAALYVQMAGRGMRVFDGKEDCLVLDFAGNVSTHGPVTNVKIPSKVGGKGNGDAPVKTCPKCNELCAISCMFCSHCGHAFPPADPPKLVLRDDDIMGDGSSDFSVRFWMWKKIISKSSGKEMLVCIYYGVNIAQDPVKEFFPVTHEGYAGENSIRLVERIASDSGCSVSFEGGISDLERIASTLNRSRPPSTIKYRKDEKFYKVYRRTWLKKAELANNPTT